MLMFGSGQVDLTPPEPLPLGGYTERRGAVFQPGGDALLARARAVGKVMLVSVEMLTVPESLHNLVRLKTGENQLILVATHTHCAPDSQMLNDRMTLQIPGIATFRRRWLEWYADRIAEAVREARADQTRPILAFTLRQMSLPYARARRPFGVPDNIATEVEVEFGDGGAPEPLFRVFAAHPTLYDETERHLRGDWPGALMANHGGLAFTGAIGDVSPVPDSPLNFANAIASGLAIPRAIKLPPTLEFSSVPLVLNRPTPHPTFAKAFGITDELARSVVSRFAPPSAAMTSLQIGPFVMIGVPGEPTAEIGRAIRLAGEKRGFHVAVVSHVNGWIGYILGKADYGRGGYEAQLALNGPKTGDDLVQVVRQQVFQSSR